MSMERRSVREREAIAQKRKRPGELEATSEESVQPQVDEPSSSAPLIWGGASLLAWVGAASAFESGTDGTSSSPSGLPEPAPKPSPVNPSPPRAPDRVMPPPEPEVDRTPPGPLALTPSGQGPDLYEVLHREPGASVRWRPVSKESEAAWTPLDANVLSIPPGQTVEIRQIDRAGNPGELTTFAAPDRALEPETEREITAETETETDAGNRLEPVQEPDPEVPPPAFSLRLKNDTGRTEAQRVDRHTSDATVVVDGLDPALFRWRFHTGDGEWQPGVGSEIASSLFPKDGEWVVTVQAQDLAGQSVGESMALPFTVDRKAPDHVTLQPSLMGRGRVSERGIYATDADASAVVMRPGDMVVTGLEEGSTWRYGVTRLATLPYRGQQPGTGLAHEGHGNATIPASAFPEQGLYAVEVNTFDRAGNPLEAPVSQAFFLDTTPPEMPRVAERDNASEPLRITNLEPGAILEYTAGSGPAVRPTDPVDLSALAPGTIVNLVQIDVAGHRSEPAVFPIPQPVPPVALTAQLKNDTGRTIERRRDRLTSDATVIVEGLDPSAHSLKYQIGTEDWKPLVGHLLPDTLFPGDGPKSVVIQALDPQGKALGKEVSLKFDVDRTPPQHARLEAVDGDGRTVEIQGRPWQAGSGAAYKRISSAEVRILGVESDGSWAYALGKPIGTRDNDIDMPANADRLPPTALKTGPNIVYFTTFDRAGNSSVDTDKSMVRDFFYLVPPTVPELTVPPAIL